MIRPGLSPIAFIAVGIVGLICTALIAQSSYSVIDVEKPGVVSGSVIFDGTPPEPKTVDNESTGNGCPDHPADQHDGIRVHPESKGVAGAVVFLADIAKGKAWEARSVKISQKKCVFTPGVVIVPEGGTIEVINNDDVTHNVRCLTELNEPFNESQPAGSKPLKHVLDFPEVDYLTCATHPWMRAVLYVAPHPYHAVTDENGAFSLGGVPAGSYSVKVWHDKLGTAEGTVDVAADGSATIELTLDGPE